MKYIIYKITNIKNKKFYIGKHQTTNIDDSYFGSGIALLKAIKKYGKENFKREILYIFDSEIDMNQKEKEIVNEEFIISNKTYNIGVGGEGGSHFKGKKHTEETKKHLSEISKNRIISEETRKKLSESNRNRIVSEKTRKKLSEKAKERFSSIESRNKHSKLMKDFYKNNYNCGVE